MKKIITFILAAVWVLNSYSQEIIQLEETMLTFVPTGEVVFEDYANGVIKVKESYYNQFQSDAIKFVNENFNLDKYREETGNRSGDIYISVISSKGRFSATYNEDNELDGTYQKFVDIALPYDIRNQVYASYEGWTMTKNKYIASGKKANIDNEKYIVFLERGNDREKLKITPARSSITGVASIEKFE